MHGEKDYVVQIASIHHPRSGGRTALSVHLTHIEDGVHVSLGAQEWLGIAASLGQSALSWLTNPAALLGRIDDIAEDVSSLQLQERVRETIENVAQSLGAAFQISEGLQRLSCPYCQTANHVGDPSCLACGRPFQPIACQNCGFVSQASNATCPQCGDSLHSSAP